jgi:CheY-like chemotaxis protein
MDSSSLWSDALESILPRIGIEVRGTATSANEALSLVGLHEPDLLIVDLGDDGDAGEHAFFDEARRRAPSLRIIALSASATRRESPASWLRVLPRTSRSARKPRTSRPPSDSHSSSRCSCEATLTALPAGATRRRRRG